METKNISPELEKAFKEYKAMGAHLSSKSVGLMTITLPVDLDPVPTINDMIKVNNAETNRISDGYHTFGELYEHRISLWVTVCRLIAHTPAYQSNFPVWRSRVHSDGTTLEGWFMLGLNKEKGDQITYHLPEEWWANTWFADTLAIAPEFDGHASADVLHRLNDVI